MENIRILAINPGSTSTKIAVYRNMEPLFLRTLRHSSDDLKKFDTVADQFTYRKELILKELENAEIRMDMIRAVVGRGGLLKPIESGVYQVNDNMLNDLRNSPIGEHASNLGGIIAYDIAKSLPDAKAYIADPVVVDELNEYARMSGHPAFRRKSIFHALNQKAISRQHAKSIMKNYEDQNFIVVHLGGGISVGAHEKGRVVDVNNALDGDGPYSPERAGSLPAGDLVSLCFSGRYTKDKVKRMLTGEGGLVAYCGTNSAYEIEQKAQAGDDHCRFMLEAMAYQIAKEIGSMGTVIKGEVDAILITGGMANSKFLVNLIIERVYKIGPVHVYPGEDELKALAMNGLMVVKGELVPKEYS